MATEIKYVANTEKIEIHMQIVSDGITILDNIVNNYNEVDLITLENLILELKLALNDKMKEATDTVPPPSRFIMNEIYGMVQNFNKIAENFYERKINQEAPIIQNEYINQQ